MGVVFAPMGALLPSLFPAEARYISASATYHIGGILGARWGIEARTRRMRRGLSANVTCAGGA